MTTNGNGNKQAVESVANSLASALGGEDAEATVRAVIADRLAEDTLMPDERAEIGRLLAEMGDTRPGVGLVGGLPDLDWCDVPAGDVLLGSDPASDADSKEREQPQHRVAVGAFRIARYPVTVAQYAAFVDAGGYREPSYWYAAGWDALDGATAPRLGWDDGRFNGPNQPVVGVSWYEASAFCRWLSAATGQPVRLPNEAAWERAARGDDGRRYPHGDDWTPASGNTAESGLERPCAVGLYPQAASPFGALDMAGNVFEWTSSLLRPYPYDATDGREDAERPGSRVFRGGAFNAPAAMARAAFRSHFYPHAYYDWVGFRVCADA